MDLMMTKIVALETKLKEKLDVTKNQDSILLDKILALEVKLDKKLDSIHQNSSKMSTHIDFIQHLYNQMRRPLSLFLGAIDNISSYIMNHDDILIDMNMKADINLEVIEPACDAATTTE